MPPKKNHRPFLFMNHKVISPEQKPVRPVMRPIVLVRPSKPTGLKFK